MAMYQDGGLSIFFGDARSCPVERTSGKPFNDFCAGLAAKFECSTLVLQDQVHGTTGLYLDAQAKPTRPASIFETQGDFLVANQPDIAIGVLTADCLPIIFFDKRNNVIAAIHAGWRSAVAGITTKAIECMLKKHFFAPNDLYVYFGACAKPCCYEVKEEFANHVAEYPWRGQVLFTRGDKLFFDLPLFNKLHLIDMGIDPRHIDLSYNDCTMCSDAYHSNRRNGHSRLCQITAAWI